MADLVFSIVTLLFLFAVGASMGSFLNLVADRLPLGQSIVFPPSACPSCSSPVPWYGLIPIFGWFLVSAKCRACASKVSAVHPLAETLVGLGTVHITLHFLNLDRLITIQSQGLVSNQWVASVTSIEFMPLVGTLWFFYLAVPLVLIDLRFRILPNKLTILGLIVALILGALNPQLGWRDSLIGAFVGSFSLYAVAWVYSLIRKREGVGFGDIKYLAFIGASVGWQKVFLCLALASFLGTIVGAILLLTSSQSRKSGLQLSVPFGPFLAAGTLAVLLHGDFILYWMLEGRHF